MFLGKEIIFRGFYFCNYFNFVQCDRLYYKHNVFSFGCIFCEIMSITLSNERYELRALLGQGGMAAVFLAWDRQLEVYRAIKILSSNYKSINVVRKRFEVEARTMAKLLHPNTVTVFDFGLENASPFLVMEVVDGGSVYDILKERTLSLQEALYIFRSALAGLNAAHKKGIIHRDIKPDNILIGDENSVKITDFGIASLQEQDQRMTRTGMIMGTPNYMPPEQRMDSSKVSIQSDYYALVASFFEMLTNKSPLNIHDSSCHEDLLEGLPEPLCEFIIKGTEPSLARRFSSVEEIEEALNKLEELIENTNKPLIYNPPEVPLERRRTNPQELKDTLFRLTGMSVVDEHAYRTNPEESDTFFLDAFDEKENQVQPQKQETQNNPVQDAPPVTKKEQVNQVLPDDYKNSPLYTENKRSGWGTFIVLGIIAAVVFGLDVFGFFVDGQEINRLATTKVRSDEISKKFLFVASFEKIYEATSSVEHKQNIKKSLYMNKYEVTQGLYYDIMGNNPSHFSTCGWDCPVEMVSWYDAVAFLNKLSEKDGFEKCYSGEEPNITFKGLHCEGYRLPTEVEWVYIAKGFQKFKYSGSDDVDQVAWYEKNSSNKTHPVGTLQENDSSMHDMSGNVAEWVYDANPKIKQEKFIRGGTYFDTAERIEKFLDGVSSYHPTTKKEHVGFRFCKTQ